ncbi:MAG TPA: amidohydrolase family protein [Acidimicrobiales bacterium]|nr:amidohydrolase family protein [Acidimicrobiales bacterium]
MTTPGLVCAHHHLYSELARGMPAPPRTPTTFTEILELVWWRLDEALDLDMIRWSAMLGALEALERGTTSIVDHHASPNAIEGSLDVVHDACREVGVRITTCYEVSDRGGPGKMKAGLAENERYIRAHPGTRAWVGAHACLTLSDGTLEAVAGMAHDLGTGVHIHVAEGAADVDAGRRLEPWADERWLLAHAVHLDRPLPGTVLHNPRSNLNNAVGYARPDRYGNRVRLGTDGIGADMLEEFRLAFVRLRAEDVTEAPTTAWAWLAWDEGSAVEWSYDPMEPWYLAYTTGVGPVSVTVDGEVVFRDGRPTRVDADEVRAKAREQAARLHARL